MAEMRKLTPVEIINMMNWKLEETAEILGVSHMTVQRRKNGTSEWTATDISILSEKSKIPVEYIDF